MLELSAALTRALLYGALLLSAGIVFAEATLRASLSRDAAAARLLHRSALAVIVMALVGSVIMLLRLGGNFDRTTLSAVFLSSVGAALCLQLVGATLLLTIPLQDEDARGIRISNAVLALSCFAFNGHAAVSGFFAGLVVLAHVSVAAWWVGSLVLLKRVCAATAPSEIVDLVRRFSSLAIKLIGILVAAGAVLILELLDFARTPWLTDYGQLLAAKLGIVAVLLSVAIYNKMHLTPRLACGDVDAARSLSRTISIELLLVAAVLVVTAFLTTYTAPDAAAD